MIIARCWALAALLAVVSPLAAAASTESPFTLDCADGFTLDGRVASPPDTVDTDARRVIVLVHGSGPQSMDQDLTVVTRDGQPNLFFKEVSDALVDVGFTVVRYHKRSHQVSIAYRDDPSVATSEMYLRFAANPMLSFVNDARDCVDYCAERFPDAEIFMLGHSQGCYVALQVAHQRPDVRGVAMIGFSQYSTDQLVFEQTVHRPLRDFQRLDVNHDHQLDATELAVDDPVANALRPAMVIIDRDADGVLIRHEIQAASLAGLLVEDTYGVYRKQEAEYPRTSEIVLDSPLRIAIFQGMFDNQTPAYHAMAFELLLEQTGQGDRCRFHFFPGLGHVLDRRSSYEDQSFGTIDPEALAAVTNELNTFFVHTPE